MVNLSNISQRVQEAIKNAFQDTIEHSGSVIVQALLTATRNHISMRYPGSTHWNPNKVVEGQSQSTTTNANGSIEVKIPGASRAYHDVVIKPIRARHLAIPIHAASYGKKPADFEGLFKIKGKNALFQKHGSGIVALFALAKQANQKQDSTLLPKDDTYATNISERLTQLFNYNLDKELHDFR